MKKTLLVILICASVNSFANSAAPLLKKVSLPPDTTVLSQILSLPLSSFVGKPVDSLFSVLPAGYSSRGFLPVRIVYNRGVYQSYGTQGDNTVSVVIFIDNYQYMIFPNTNGVRTWDINLAKQETISFIKVIKNNNVCLYGCNNSSYFY